MFLAVTPLREFWDTSDELLFAGPWCIPYDRRSELEGLRHRFLPDVWRDVDRFRAATASCRDISENLLVQLADYLNSVHGTSHGVRYWRLLLNQWLAHHVQQMYGHQVRLQDALAAEPRLTSILLDPAQYETPRDTLDFIRLSYGDRYQLQMFSILLEALSPGLPRRRLAREPEPRMKVSLRRDAGLLRRVVARSLGWFTPPGLGRVLACELNLPSAENKSVVISSKLRILPYLAQLPESLKPPPQNDARRAGLAGLRGRDAFERALISALPTHFPSLYLEGYRDARRYSMARVWRTPKTVFSSVGWYYNEAFKFAAAECAENGSELWGVQHGGGYGIWEHADGEAFERSVVDRFYCWGWSSLARDPKVRDLPHPMFARSARALPNEDVVIVATALDLHDIRLIRAQQGDQAYDYLDRQARLWNGVSGALPGRAYYRLHAVDHGWNLRRRFQDRCPDIRFDDASTPFSERLRTARLLIFDNPMTTFLEAFGADHPCLLTWNPGSWPFRPEAQPFFDRLKEVGILYDDPEAAARRAAAIHVDPRSWWDEPRRRAVHREFAERFALARPDWLKVWLEALSAA